jgi:lipopolysaccharide/colanic/teichoic acid biosynthesis glycosyltransferase
MLRKTLGLTSHHTTWPAEAAPFRTPRRQFDFPNPWSWEASHLFSASSSPPLDLTTHLVPPHQCLSGAGRPVPSTKQIPRLGLFIKRIVDLFLSAAALLFLWPLMLLIAIAVKLESPGPVIYSAIRAGKKGRTFVCYKFRTMVDGANGLKGGLRPLNQRRGPFFKIADDPRVTRLGRLLRRYSLDELPQFWNVLKGDMTLVGPRPHPLDDVALYLPEHHFRLDVKPGLTGLWQVTARTDPSFATCFALDLAYIRRWSLLLDCRILLRTIPEVLSGNGE